MTEQNNTWAITAEASCITAGIIQQAYIDLPASKFEEYLQDIVRVMDGIESKEDFLQAMENIKH